jgi:phosphate transport system protein
MLHLRKRSLRTEAQAPPLVEHRTQFHQDLAALEGRMRAMAAQAQRSLELSMQAVLAGDAALRQEVIDGDESINDQCQAIQGSAVDLLGRQQPVASDLRLLVALIQVALHLERIGDMAVNIVEAAQASTMLGTKDEVTGQLERMCEMAVSMTEQAVTAFGRRDRALCEQLPARDDQVDEIYRGMIGSLLDLDDDPERQQRALRTLQVCRYLERAADHAVDIAEQAWFLITGQLRELD